MAARGQLSVEQRFAMQWMPEPNSGCWLWLGTISNVGYGKLYAFGQTKASAHRVSYQLHVGAIPDGMMVLHHCDVRPCVNPDHLFLGTADDNTKDMLSKGRHRTRPNHGAANHNAKLTEDDVRMIKASMETGVILARQLNVTPRVIYLVRHGQTWSHIQ
jgi:hypothetical protein